MKGTQQLKPKCLGGMEKLLQSIPWPLQKSKCVGRIAFKGLRIFVAVCIEVNSCFLFVLSLV